MFKRLIDSATKSLQNASNPVDLGAETAEQIKKATSRRAKSTASKVISQEYTVKSGDSLSAIAQKFYGNAGEWDVIYQANKRIIGDNPNMIQVGQTLKIPK